MTEFITENEEMMKMIIGWGTRILGAILIMVTGWMIGNFLERRFDHINRLDETLKSFLGGFVKYAVFIVAIITVIGLFGIPMASLLAILGAAGLAIGLAMQGTLSNVAAGVMLLILRPFKVGDFIEFGGQMGTVKTLGLFGTELATIDNRYVFAPNSQIWGTEITNYSRNLHRRQDIPVGISYDDDINKAMEVIHAELDKEKRLIRTEGKEPIVKVGAMADFSINLIVRIWTQTSDYFDVQWDLNKAIKEALDANGITIPFPTQIEILKSELDKEKKKKQIDDAKTAEKKSA